MVAAKHLALIEDFYSTHKLRGTPLGDPWDGSDLDGDEREFRSAADDAPEQL